MKPHSLLRRDFLRASALATLGFSILPSRARGANARIQVGCVGVNGKGYQDARATAEAGAQIVALCDVVDPRNPELGRRKILPGERLVDLFPAARQFTDYREMIATMPGLDAVVISTPDHHHFHATMAALRRGLHVYCQKPIAHSVWEARRLTEVARETNVQTQMGNQAHAGEPVRRAVELLRAGVVGRVREVHLWTDRPIWPQGMDRWPEPQLVPAGLDWEQWIGPAPFCEYSPAIAPFAWRGWWDFGAGALGDMGCHILDMPFWALGLTAPETVEATQVGGTDLCAPLRSIVTWTFPAGPWSGPVSFVWYDGLSSTGGPWRHGPPEDLWRNDFPTADHVFRRFDLVVVGDAGRMYFGRTRQDWVIKTDGTAPGSEAPPQTLPRVPGGERNGKGEDSGGAYAEWLGAIRTGEPALSNFSVAGPLSETVLLGNVALRLGRRVRWDARKLEVKGEPEAARLIRRSYRKGWELS